MTCPIVSIRSKPRSRHRTFRRQPRRAAEAEELRCPRRHRGNILDPERSPRRNQRHCRNLVGRLADRLPFLRLDLVNECKGKFHNSYQLWKNPWSGWRRPNLGLGRSSTDSLMPIKRASCQRSESLEGFYEDLAASTDSVSSSIGRQMLELLPML